MKGKRPTLNFIEHFGWILRKTKGTWYTDIDNAYKLQADDMFAFLGNAEAIEKFYHTLIS